MLILVNIIMSSMQTSHVSSYLENIQERYNKQYLCTLAGSLSRKVARLFIRDACAKGTSSLFSMADIGVRPCRLNTKTSIDLYRKVVMPTVLYGCEVWNKLKTCDVYKINKFQRMTVKKRQGFQKYVRTGMCESMVGAISLSFEVKEESCNS